MENNSNIITQVPGIKPSEPKPNHVASNLSGFQGLRVGYAMGLSKEKHG